MIIMLKGGWPVTWTRIRAASRNRAEPINPHGLLWSRFVYAKETILSLELPTVGDWPTWVGAFGALLVFSVAVYTLVLQRRSSDESRHQSRREQASKIWAKMIRLDHQTPGTEVTFQFIVQNRSGLPCYYTYFEVFDKDRVHYHRLGTLSTEYSNNIDLSAVYANHWPFFRITFMDSANVFWERTSFGNLRETSDGNRPRQHGKTFETFAERRARDVQTGIEAVEPGAPIIIPGLLPASGTAPVLFSDVRLRDQHLTEPDADQA